MSRFCRPIILVSLALAGQSISAEESEAPDPLFQDLGTLGVTITAPLKILIRNRPTEDYLPGVFEWGMCLVLAWVRMDMNGWLLIGKDMKTDRCILKKNSISLLIAALVFGGCATSPPSISSGPDVKRVVRRWMSTLTERLDQFSGFTNAE